MLEEGKSIRGIAKRVNITR
ncbi:hypothetical protein EGX64_08420 [Staphylococcus epidermidis]|nr:hypothetical protein EGX64_08420 [Staphylococcus epidermidis]PIH13925.1 hypothetical protein CTJ10_01510 [Staphylococcus epidermidis]